MRRGRFAPGNGLRLHYTEWGPAGGSPLLLLHGLGGHGLTWERAAARLAQRYRCIAPDARGHGASDWAGPGGYASDEHFADIPVLLDALGLERVAVAGFSMGAAAAIQFAASLPERCEALIVIDAYPDPTPSAGSQTIAHYYASLPDTFRSVDDAIRAAGPTLDAHEQAALDLTLRHLGDRLYTWRQDPAIREELRKWIDGDREEIRRADLWPFWRAIAVPTLIVRGSRSSVLTPEMARRMLDDLPHAELVQLECGHGVLLEQPQALAEQIDTFLQRVLSLPGSPESP